MMQTAVREIADYLLPVLVCLTWAWLLAPMLVR